MLLIRLVHLQPQNPCAWYASMQVDGRPISVILIVCRQFGQEAKPNCQTAMGMLNRKIKDAKTRTPSLIRRPAAKSAIIADAIEPDVGITSMKGINKVSANIEISGSQNHGGLKRKESRSFRKGSTKRTGLRSQ